MLRTIRISAPAERLGELIATSREGAWDVKDYCVDSDPDARWPWAGDNRAAILLVVEDKHHSATETFTAFSNAWASLGQDPAELTLGKSYVFWPDGCSIETYRVLDPLTVALHAIEERCESPEALETDHLERERLHSALSIPLAQALETGEAALAEFSAAMEAVGIKPEQPPSWS